jgi:IclR-like helix-turn-helix domain-containing protein
VVHRAVTGLQEEFSNTLLEEAERERIWAIVAAHDAGLSIRKIAAATGLSRSRIHQLLQKQEAHEIPTWLTHLRDCECPPGRPSDTEQHTADASLRAHIAREVEVLRWCMAWLEQLAQGEMVVVNLRPETDDHPQLTQFDHPRVMRVLARITADFDVLAHRDSQEEVAVPEDGADPLTRHQRRLAEPEEKPRGRTAKEQREAIRKAAGLPPYNGDYADYFRGTY